MRFKIGILLVLLATVSAGSTNPAKITKENSQENTEYDSDHESAATNNIFFNKSRIYNGDVVQSSDTHYTFMVAIVVIDRGNVGVVCGGSLINKRWVLTAGHCVNDYFRQAIRDKRVVCWIGAYNTGVPENSDFRAQINVENLVEHTPPWKGKQVQPEDQRYDIALLRLSADVNTANFKPICIGNSYYKSGGVTLLGWGRYDGVRQPDRLNRAYGDIVDLKQCQDKYQRNLVQKTMICAKLRNKDGGNAEQASGDSGGPLFFSPKQGRYIQVGIVSFNINLPKMNPDNAAEPDVPNTEFPGVYTRTYSYIDFMRNTIRSRDPNLNIETCTS